MVYCQKCGEKNCGNSLTGKSVRSNSFEKQIGDFAEEVEHLGKKAGKTIEEGVKNLSEEVKDIGKRVDKIIQNKTTTSDDSTNGGSEEYKRLYRSGNNKFIGGVCGGIAEYFKIDPTLVRIIWAIIVFFPPGLGIILYVLFWIFVPRNPSQSWN